MALLNTTCVEKKICNILKKRESGSIDINAEEWLTSGRIHRTSADVQKILNLIKSFQKQGDFSKLIIKTNLSNTCMDSKMIVSILDSFNSNKNNNIIIQIALYLNSFGIIETCEKLDLIKAYHQENLKKIAEQIHLLSSTRSLDLANVTDSSLIINNKELLHTVIEPRLNLVSILTELLNCSHLPNVYENLFVCATKHYITLPPNPDVIDGKLYQDLLCTQYVLDEGHIPVLQEELFKIILPSRLKMKNMLNGSVFDILNTYFFGNNLVDSLQFYRIINFECGNDTNVPNIETNYLLKKIFTMDNSITTIPIIEDLFSKQSLKKMSECYSKICEKIQFFMLYVHICRNLMPNIKIGSIEDPSISKDHIYFYKNKFYLNEHLSTCYKTLLEHYYEKRLN